MKLIQKHLKENFLVRCFLSQLSDVFCRPLIELTLIVPPPEKETAAHSSVLAWRIPGMAEPGGLPSVGSHRVRHNWSDLAAAAAAVPPPGLPRLLSGRESTCNTGDLGSIPGSGRSPGEGNSKALQYSCLENPMDQGACGATVCGAAQSWTRLKWLSSSSSRSTLKMGCGDGYITL